MIITRTPLRVSFLGGNTDFPQYYKLHEGLVLTTTIDKYIYCIVKERFDDLIIVNYTIKETVKDVKKIKHDLVREALQLMGIKKGIEITFIADIPSQGTGLGSSSSVTVGLLTALHAYLGKSVTPLQLALEAIRIELDELEKPIGIQDQCAVALGGLRHLAFKVNVETKKIPLPESVKEDFNNSLMLFYTDITRKSDEILKTIDFEKDKDLIDESKQLATDGAVALAEGNLKKFGGLLDKYWKSKKKLSKKISNTKIDKMYKLAMDAGAFGGKVLGAGGGGFLLVMFPANKRAKIRKALKDYRELPFRFEDSGSKVIFDIR